MSPIAALGVLVVCWFFGYCTGSYFLGIKRIKQGF